MLRRGKTKCRFKLINVEDFFQKGKLNGGLLSFNPILLIFPILFAFHIFLSVLDDSEQIPVGCWLNE